MIKLPKLPSKIIYRKIAVLTSGGDAPGMNAALRAVVRYGISHKIEVYGIYRGYQGVLDQDFEKMELSSVGNIIQRGGTILKTARCLDFHKKSVRKKAADLLRKNGIEALVVIGGDGSFTGAYLLEKEFGFPCIGVPGTIDNDIAETDDSIGFDTAINTAMEAIDRIRDTASSHERIFLVEVMGRNSGFIALNTGISGGAENILVPEHKINLNSIHKSLLRSKARGKNSSILIVAEGKTPGRANELAKELKKLNHHTRVCTLGHIQRGGSPSARDRVLGSLLGASAVAYLCSGRSSGMVGTFNNEVRFVDFKSVIAKKKKISEETLMLAETLAT